MDLSALESISRAKEASIDYLEIVLFVFTGLVVVGLVLEYWHDAADFIEEVRRPAVVFPWKKFMELGGGVIVVIGVGGELFTQYFASRAESELRANSHVVEGVLSGIAEIARNQANEALLEQEKLRLDNINLQSVVESNKNLLSTRLEKAAAGLDSSISAARKQLSQIEEQVKLQTPRWQLLDEGQTEFIEALKPFAGQSITILKCGRQTSDIEAYGLEQHILNFIGKPTGGSPGASWETSYQFWEECGAGGGTTNGGNRIAVSDKADDSVKRAAATLEEVLNKLGIFTLKLSVQSDPYGVFVRFMGADSPDLRALRDPKSIFLLVGSNPMYDVAGFRKRHSAKP